MYPGPEKLHYNFIIIPKSKAFTEKHIVSTKE